METRTHVARLRLDGPPLAAEHRLEAVLARDAGSWSGQLDGGCTTATVLVIDDNEPILMSAAQLLSHAGFVPSIVRSGRVALSVLERSAFDLVVVDFFMPEMTGDEFVRAVRGHANPAARQVPIVGLSGSCRTEALLTRAGATACIRKPFQPKQLLGAVTRVLRGGR